MSDGHTDSRGSQTKLQAGMVGNVENRAKSVTLMVFEWKQIVAAIDSLETEMRLIESTIYDQTELIGILAARIEEWVGVAEE